MNDRYRLDGVANDRLLASLSALVRRENDSLSDLLAHLAELDDRGLCLELGYSSLFAYCVEVLRFSKSSAGRRIAAARVCRKYPEAFARVANGELKLSVLVELNKYLSSENAAELFSACSGKSYEQVELLLAARFPKPDVRDLVRRLPNRTVVTPDIGCAPARSMSGTAAPACDEPSAAPSVPPQTNQPHRPGAVKPLSAERYSVNFTADAEFHPSGCSEAARELLEEVRALVSHAEPKGDLMHVMKRGLQALKAELLKKRFGVGRKPRRARTNAAGTGLATRTRHVAADVSRAVWERDRGQCTFCSAEGRRCSERSFLQMDHVRPCAAGGRATLCNLRLRCRAHNLHAARIYFGAKFMRASLRRVRAASGCRALLRTCARGLLRGDPLAAGQRYAIGNARPTRNFK